MNSHLFAWYVCLIVYLIMFINFRCVVHSVGILLGMSAKRLNDWCLQLFTVEQNVVMCLRFESFGSNVLSVSKQNRPTSNKSTSLFFVLRFEIHWYWDDENRRCHKIVKHFERLFCLINEHLVMLTLSCKKIRNISSMTSGDWKWKCFTVKQFCWYSGKNYGLMFRYDNTFERCLNFASLVSNPEQPMDSDKERSASEISAEVTSVCGVLLPTIPGMNNLVSKSG